jgi:hypothetical protein
LGGGTANAATVIYHASGYWFGENQFYGEHLNTLGSLTIDQTTGEIILGGANITVAKIGTFNFVEDQIEIAAPPPGTSFVLADKAGNEMVAYLSSPFLNGKTPILPTSSYIDDQQGNELAGNWPTGQFSITPIPAALPLFASGLGAMGLFGWRRKRKNAAALTARVMRAN